MEKALKFYCGTVGLKKAFELNDDMNRPWIVYLKIADDQFLELFYGGVHDPASNNVLINQPSQGKDYNYQCWSSDPDGNMIEFMMIDPRSPQVNS